MGESRKSDFTGEIYGDWVVIGRGEGEGDRKRRWVVRNEVTGVEMTVLQTGLSDLALAKNLADKAAATDAARVTSSAPLTPEQAEADLLSRLDTQVGLTLAAWKEARASVALDGDTYSIDGMTVVLPNHPFNDYYALAEAELAAGDPFGFSSTTLAIIADKNRCLDCEEDRHPLPRGHEGPMPPYLDHQVEAIEAQLTAALQDATGDDTLSVVYDRRPLMASGPGMALEPVTVALSDEFKGRLYTAAEAMVEAGKAAKVAEDLVCAILEDLLP